MKTNPLVKIGVLLALVLSVIAIAGHSSSKAVGGNFNPVPVEFSKGITVGGTEVINSSGQYTGALSSALASSIGSITAGLNYFKPVITPTVDTTLTVAQSGTIVNMGTAGLDVTLPAPTVANGVHYRFVVSAAFATTNMTIVAGTADTIEGSLIVAGAVVDCSANDLITLVATSEDIGDFVDLYSNGTYWLIGANQTLAASNTTCTG